MMHILKLALDAGVEFNMFQGLGDVIHGPDLGKHIRNGKVTVEEILHHDNNGNGHDRNLVLLIGGRAILAQGCCQSC